MSYAQLAQFVVKLLGIPGPYTPALERTNWQVGSVELKILMLSIVYRGVGFPVVSLVSPWPGNSDLEQRKLPLELFFKQFGAANIVCLLGDREFVGKEWFRFLRQHKIQFQMRLKKDTQVRNARGQLVPAWRLFAQTARQAHVSDPGSAPHVVPGVISERLLLG